MQHSRRSALPPSSPRSVGLDVHKDSLAVAYGAQEHHAAVVSLGTMGPRPCAIAQLVRQLHSKSTPLICVEEAGPCGAWLSRYLTQHGQVCWGSAPALLPQQTGDRGNTNRREAITLARLRRSGDLTPVYVPQVEEAAMRDLGRARAEASHARKTAKLRLNALLLRQASRATGRATWGPAPLRWRSAVVCPPPAPHIVLPADLRAVTAHTARRERFEQARPAQGQPWRRRSVVDALQAWRGGQFPGAVTAVAALGDLTVAPPRPLRRSLGLTPAAYATGARRRQDGIPTAGKSQARRALREGAWASRSPATVRRPRPLRLEKVPQSIEALRWQAQVRLCKRSRQLRARGKNATPVVVAIACELRALMGAMAQEVPRLPEAQIMERPGAVRTPFCLCIGRDAAPVWCNPRRRAAAATHPRAETEAGTRRTPGRWYPSHGEQQDQPSSLTGSGSADGQRTRGQRKCQRIGNQFLTLEVISTPGFTCCRKPQRRRSEGSRQSGASPC